MKHIVSKYDKDTIYGIATQYVNVQRDGEVMRIPFRQIPTVSQVFCEEVKAELMAIYDERYPIEPCPICGEPVRRINKQIYCSDKCRDKAQNLKKQAHRSEQKTEIVKKCPMCGSVFFPPSNRWIYCSDECKKLAVANQVTYKGKGGKRKPKKDPTILTRLNQEARSKGLTYGQLQAQKYIKQMKGVLEE